MAGRLATEGVTELTAAIAPGRLASERVAEYLGLVVSDEVRDTERIWRRRGMTGPTGGQNSGMTGASVDPNPHPARSSAPPLGGCQHRRRVPRRERRCRYQFADLSEGRIDAQGCLVCPWHAAAFRLDDGVMVRGSGFSSRCTGACPATSVSSRARPGSGRCVGPVARDEHGRLTVQ